MSMMKALLAGALIAASASVAGAATKKDRDCTYQGQVVAAVQQARLDRVKERDVRSHVEAKADWPEQYNNTIPLLAGWIYGSDVKMKDLREKNFGAAWREICLAQ
jgi:glutaredoxin-related protein